MRPRLRRRMGTSCWTSGGAESDSGRPATGLTIPPRARTRIILVALVASCLGWCGCSKPKLQLNEGAQHFVAARAALASGDKVLALSELDAAIAAVPDVWMYFERGKLHADEGRDEQAKADCTDGLALDPEHPDLLWLQGEMKKLKSRRFKGQQAEPPMGSK